MMRIWGAVLAVFFSLLIGSGCTQKIVKEYVEVPVEVRVPIAIKCKSVMPDEPTINIGKMTTPTTVDGKGVLLMRELEDNRRYAKELKAALSQCAE